MKSRFGKFSIVKAAFVTLIIAAAASSAPLKTGDLAPAIMLRDIDGKMVQLTDYCGGRCPLEKRKITLIHFFATTCKPCLQEIPALKKLRETLSEDDFVIVMVAVGDKDADVIKYRNDHEITGIFLVDKFGAYAKKYGAAGTDEKKSTNYNLPYSVIVDKMGFVRAVLPGAHKDLDEQVFKILKTIK